MSVVLQTGVMQYRKNEQDTWHPLIIKAETDFSALIDPYDPTATKTWVVGEYCLYDNRFRRCITQTSTPGAFDPTKWVETTIGDELEAVKASIASEATTRASEDTSIRNTLNDKAAKVDLTNISQTSPNCTVTNGIANGTYFYLDGVLTRATAPISENAPFTSSNCETVTVGGLNALINGDDITSQISGISGSVQYAKKIGHKVTVKGTTASISAASAYQTCGTIASEYRPSTPIPGILSCLSDGDFGYGQAFISTAGVITVIFSRTTTYGLSYQFEYLI